MKKIFLLLLVLFFQITFGQNNLTETQKLVATCKVWGYLKYYHPKVANGEFNWDKQLLEVLPKVEQAKTKEAYSLVIENWINTLGEVKKVAPIIQQKDIEYFDKNFDLSWIDKNKLFVKNISKKLRFIEKNRFQGDQHYIGALEAENIFVKNEDFSEFNANNKNNRVLALFTYWNIMEYFFPYKYLMDNKWDIVLEKIIPSFIEANNEEDFYLAMQKLTTKINDSHVVFFRYKKDNKKHFLPVFGKIIGEKLIITEVLNSNLTTIDGIKAGDVITRINDKTIKELIAVHRDLIGASNEPSYLDKIIEPLLSGPTENIKIEFEVNGASTTKTINWIDYNSNRYMLQIEVKKGVKKEKIKILENNIGYVNMGNLKVKDVPEMIEKLKETKTIIFDMRNYPNQTFDEISKFLNAKEKTFAIYTKPDLSYPGRFKWTEGTKCGFENKNNYKGKVIVLLNEESVSQSEWTAMCFQTAGNTTIIGSQTAGADGNVSDVDYMKAFHSQFSGIGVYYPDRRETQRIGIIPDIIVKPTIKGIQDGKDEVLDRALEFIKTGK
jgi:C-terminal processing protease CtpA/Prc